MKPAHIPSDNKTSEDTSLGVTYTVGSALRSAREDRGETIPEVAQLLRINWRYLEALEDGRFDELPGTAYITGFIRTYSEHLEIDSVEMVALYKEVTGGVAKKTKLDFPSPIPESGVPGGAILFAGLFLAVVAYGSWYMATEEDSFLAKLVTPVPETETTTTQSEVETLPETTDTVVEQVEVEQEQSSFTPPVEEIEEIEESEETEQIPDEVVETESAPSESVSSEPASGEPVESEAVVESTPTETTTVEATVVEEASETVPEPVVAVVEVVVEPEPVAPAVDVSEMEPVQEPETPSVETAEITEAVEQTQSDVVTQEAAALALNQEQLDSIQASITEGEGNSEFGDVQEPEAAPEAETSVEDPVEPVVEATVETTTEDVAEPIAEAQEPEPAVGTASLSSIDEAITGRVYGETGDVRVVVVANINSWIQVKNENTGELLLTRLLRKGDAYRVPAQEGLTLLTGNAGALNIFVDGASIPPIGGSGDVRRNVALDADLLLSGNASAQ